MPTLFNRILYKFLTLFFQLLYHQLAWSYDLVATAVSLGMWKSWVTCALPYLTGPRVLELGYGPGHLQVAMQAKKLEGFGLDASLQMSRQARRRLLRRGGVPRLIRGKAQSLPFAAESFDQVVATFPSEYIIEIDTLHEIWRVLRPHGWIVVVPTAWITSTKPLAKAARLLFQITRQAPAWDDHYLDPVRQVGFQARTEIHQLPGSQVLVVLAEKI